MIKFQNKVFQDAEIAVLIATYNGEKYLCDQFRSLLNQNFSKFVCFIHDDGSTDETYNILEKYCLNYPEKFVLVEGQKCGGAKQNFMYLLRLIQADYIMFCDQDDYWLPSKIKKSYETMKSVENLKGRNIPICVYSDLIIVNERLQTIYASYFKYTGKEISRNFLPDLFKTNVVVGCTMMINMELRERALKMQNIDNIFMHDWWCALICGAQGEFGIIQEPLVLYRQHIENTIGAKGRPKWYERLKKVISIKRWIQQRKQIIDRQRKFAFELLNVIPFNNRYYSFVNELAEIGEKNKIERVAFYYHNHLFNEQGSKILQVIFL